jgi:hypothetical protein
MRPVTTPPVMVLSEEPVLDEAAVLVGVEVPSLVRVRN